MTSCTHSSSASALPFTGTFYSLAGCSLEPLDSEDILFLSQQLATMDPWITLGYSPESLSRYLRRLDPALARYAICIGGETCGVVCVRYPWLLGPNLELLAILPGRQRHGIGRTILEWMESECRGIARNIWTLTSSFNEKAMTFYRQAGFSEVAPLPDLVRQGLDEILLRKVL